MSTTCPHTLTLFCNYENNSLQIVPHQFIELARCIKYRISPFYSLPENAAWNRPWKNKAEVSTRRGSYTTCEFDTLFDIRASQNYFSFNFSVDSIVSWIEVPYFIKFNDFVYIFLQEYLRSLHELHEDWLIRKNKFTCPAPVLVLEADQDLESMNNIYMERRKEILCGYSWWLLWNCISLLV